jgi:hypothetical protein
MSDPDDLVQLTTTVTSVEAAAIISALDRAGIKAVMGNVNSAAMIPEAMEVEVLIAQHDLPRATTLLRLLEEHGADVDWSQVDVGEPESDAPAADTTE